MYTFNARHHRIQSLDHVFNLAHSGQVAHAIVMWNKHMDAHEGCVCDGANFDQKLCGFCLMGHLQTAGLAQITTHGSEQFLRSAEGISRFLMGRSMPTVCCAAE